VFNGLWRTDGTAAGTGELFPGTLLAGLDELVVAGGRLFFSGSGALGAELCVTDGTAAGTVVVKDIRSGSSSSSPSSLVAVGSRVFFLANDGLHGNELWVSDGTAAGTQMVADLTPGASSSTFYELTAFAGELWFAFADGRGRELWHSDGTAAGTQALDLNPGSTSSYPLDLCVMGGKLYFGAQHATLGNEPWVSDGTPAGTQMLRDAAPGSASTNPYGFFASGNRLYFVAYLSATGFELWTSDGTAAGTAMVKDVLPGASSSKPKALAVLPNGAVVLAADDGGSGEEAWRSDGTAAGTFRLTDIAPGALASAPGGFCVHGTQVLFAADDLLIGRELYTMPLDGRGAAAFELYGTGCAGQGSLVPTLDANGMPSLGNQRFALLLAAARPSTAAAGLLAIDTANIPIGGGCALLLMPPVLVSFTLPTDALGQAALNLPVPADPNLAGARLAVQAAVLDPEGAFQSLASLSNAVRLTLGR
jgi:ELWxxDGT repeat protein